jgi:hypothetical protein
MDYRDLIHCPLVAAVISVPPMTATFLWRWRRYPP